MKPIRCAIYTRKSTEEGLEQNFNSLHAQREACEAYILSQAGEGWVALPEVYDDGGFSGGNMERPGLKALLAAVTHGEVDVIVVYKVDRLTRSLADFAKIVERLDGKGASFVSVTQAFNTTTSMGRLTLNVLLSFAQFEREVTGERIRDKIAASKAKGLWMGGRAPLGYDAKDRKLVVNAAEAEQIRALFARYLALRSVPALRAALAREGERSKSWTDRQGVFRPGAEFTRGALYHLLSNPTYRGAIRHKDKVYPDAHPAIVDAETFDAAQKLLKSNAPDLPGTPKRGERAFLQRILFDEQGCAMQPIHARKAGRRYRYYVSASRLQGGKPVDNLLDRISAGTIEACVMDAVQPLLRAGWRVGEGERDRVHAALRRVELAEDRVNIRLTPEAIADVSPEVGELLQGEVETLIALPIRLKPRSNSSVIRASGAAAPPARKPDRALVRAVSMARTWIRDLEDGTVGSLKELARREGLCNHYAGKLAPLGYLAPDLVEAILEGRQPQALTLSALTREPLPLDWAEQRRLVANVG